MKAFAQDETGATAIEYGLIAGLIALGLITVLITTATELKQAFADVEAGLKMRP